MPFPDVSCIISHDAVVSCSMQLRPASLISGFQSKVMLSLWKVKSAVDSVTSFWFARVFHSEFLSMLFKGCVGIVFIPCCPAYRRYLAIYIGWEVQVCNVTV